MLNKLMLFLPSWQGSRWNRSIHKEGIDGKLVQSSTNAFSHPFVTVSELQVWIFNPTFYTTDAPYAPFRWCFYPQLTFLLRFSTFFAVMRALVRTIVSFQLSQPRFVRLSFNGFLLRYRCICHVYAYYGVCSLERFLTALCSVV